MAENPRIEELRRRVQMDPASIAFAALAEEFRRQGRHEEAIQTCRGGLQRHPSYLSARVTLGRALLEVGDYDGAREELETVLRSAPENLAAIRGLALIHERLGHSTEMDPQLAAVMRAEAQRAEAARAAAPAPPPPLPLRVVEAEPAAESGPEPEAPLFTDPSFTIQLEPVVFEQVTELPFDHSLEAFEPESHESDPAMVATLSRLERFLAGIQTARHA